MGDAERNANPTGGGAGRMGAALGRAFAAARARLGMTIEEVSLAARVAPATVRRVEAGEVAPFTLNTLERIGRALDADFELEFYPLQEELIVLASVVEAPVRVLVRVPLPEPED